MQYSNVNNDCWETGLSNGITQYSLEGIGQLKCDSTRAESRFRLSAKRASTFKSAWGRQFSRLLAAEVCASAVVMLDTPCSEVVWRALATNCIRQFPLYFLSRVSPCAITFQLDSNAGYTKFRSSVKGTGYPPHSPVSPSLPFPCVTVCHHISTRVSHNISCGVKAAGA
jgi:hypothetical protein